jgi:hypothetical protein
MKSEAPDFDSLVKRGPDSSLDAFTTQVDAKFIAQEHRLFSILRNAWEYSSAPETDPRRQAARDALVFRLIMAFVPRAAVTGAGIAGIAGLLLAWQANSLVREQNDLLRLQAVAERQVVYRATISNKDSNIEAIQLRPISSESALLGGAIFFPSAFHETPLPINQDGEVHHLGSLGMDVRKFVKANHAPFKDHIAMLVLHIPVLVLSSYVAKNETYDDVSLYDVELQVTYSEESFVYPGLAVAGFSFMQRLPSAPEQPQEFIDDIYRQFCERARIEE